MAKEPERLSAQQRSKIRRLTEPKELAPDEEGGELNIIPFLDIVTNVLMFVLATVSVTFTATIETQPPRANGRPTNKPDQPTLGLTVIVVPDGFSVKARGGNVAAGCNEAGAGLAVAKKDGDYDYASLNACVKKLKNLSADFKDETSVTISANPNIPYQAIIGTIDAVRSDADLGCDPTKTDEQSRRGCLFPDVNFGLAR